jgi:uncharacterized protein DUF1553/uncharacterized protein DUF1549/concanavalin A-like lectin/glucanase superfamily protein/cytochrome c
MELPGKVHSAMELRNERGKPLPQLSMSCARCIAAAGATVYVKYPGSSDCEIQGHLGFPRPAIETLLLLHVLFLSRMFISPMRAVFHSIALACFTTTLALGVSASSAPVNFSRDVLPILSDACFQCHGPDAKNGQKAGLRLDTKEGIFRTKDGVTVVKPGKIEESALVIRVTSDDPDEVMPPPKANRHLKPDEKELLKRWVAEGAPWGQHWAFEPMRKAEPPGIADCGLRIADLRKRDGGRAEELEKQLPALAQWPENPIDWFVLERMVGEGLTPSPEASPERLIRRMTFDLTGLPPTPAEVDTFKAESIREPQSAIRNLVDRLLASPRYGERMATEWLDVARFADTHGFQMDAVRDMSPWRDWVIKAFNENLSYDKFVTWQLAGDLLPNATKEQRLATAFNRLHTQNEEGGIVPEEFRVAYNVDRVTTFGTAFLALTFECSRCHDHKFDPITQRDFYSLFAFFQNIDETGAIPYSGAVTDMPVPAMLLSTDAQDTKLAELQTRIAAQEKELAAVREQARPDFEKWLGQRAGEPPVPGAVGEFGFDEITKDISPNAANAVQPAKAHEAPKLVPGKVGQAVALDGDNGFTFPGIGKFKRTDAFSLSLWLRPGPPAPSQVVVHRTRWATDAASRGYELLLENGRVSFALNNYAPENALKVTTREPLPPETWSHLTISYDGSSRAAGVRIFRDGVPVAVEIVRDGLTREIDSGDVALTLGYRDRDTGAKGSAVDELRVFSRELSAIEAAHLAGRPEFADAWTTPAEKLTASQRNALLDCYLATADPAAAAARKQLQASCEEQSALVQSIREIMVMKELPQPKKAYILKRGVYDSHGDEVHADTPHALPPFPADAPRNRLGLARWLLDPEHPLMARVTVNRLWQMMFGRGIVETSDNFGLQGATPTHPELLDWLARDFIASGWNVKATLRKIALSATYRQASGPERGSAQFSVLSAQLEKATGNSPITEHWTLSISKDPDNRLLSHGTARRLTAEMLRDQALADSGLLAEKLGGPSVKPYQPGDLWDIAMGRPKYNQSHGPDLYRRSIYTFVKRTVPPPAMAAFDVADRSYCTVRRQSTSTPLQALALLNDVQFVEAARLIGQRMLTEGGATLDAQLAWAFQLVTGRPPSAKETPILARLYAGQHDIFASDEPNAAKLLAVGETKSNPALRPADLAAATVFAEALLNFDEAVMRR